MFFCVWGFVRGGGGGGIIIFLGGGYGSVFCEVDSWCLF